MPIPPRTRRRCIGAALALALAWRAAPPARWLWDRVRADQDVLEARVPSMQVEAGERVLVVSPHLDDETLGAGGLLAHLKARKVPVRVVFLTNGDGSGSTILALNFRHGRRFSFVESALARQKEALAALAKLGIAPTDVAFLGYPDGDLQTMWDRWDGAAVRSRFTHLTRVPYANAPGAGSEFRGSNLLRDLGSQLEAFRPTRVLSTHGADAHPDHWSADAFARLALQVLAERQHKIEVEHEVEHDGFVIHHGIFPLPHGNHPEARLNIPAPLLNGGTLWRDFALSEAEQRAKRDALEQYVSQLAFTPNYLRAFVRPNEPLGQAPELRHSGEWSDETRETWALAQNPSADVEAVSVGDGASQLELSLGLAAPPAAGVLYTLNIKCIFEDGRVRSHRVNMGRGRSEFWAREADSGRSVNVLGDSRTLSAALPWDALKSQGKPPSRLVIDASTWSGPAPGAAMLDRTESRSIKLY